VKAAPANEFQNNFSDEVSQAVACLHGSKGSIASVVKKRKEKNPYINNSI
jgi:hypothetical protein